MNDGSGVRCPAWPTGRVAEDGVAVVAAMQNAYHAALQAVLVDVGEQLGAVALGVEVGAQLGKHAVAVADVARQARRLEAGALAQLQQEGGKGVLDVNVRVDAVREEAAQVAGHVLKRSCLGVEATAR